MLSTGETRCLEDVAPRWRKRKKGRRVQPVDKHTLKIPMFHDTGYFRVARRGCTHQSTVSAFVAQVQIRLSYDLIPVHTNTSNTLFHEQIYHWRVPSKYKANEFQILTMLSEFQRSQNSQAIKFSWCEKSRIPVVFVIVHLSVISN